MICHNQVAKTGYFQWQSNPIKWGTKLTFFLSIRNKTQVARGNFTSQALIDTDGNLSTHPAPRMFPLRLTDKQIWTRYPLHST